jgi:hypothetical protein
VARQTRVARNADASAGPLSASKRSRAREARSQLGARFSSSQVPVQRGRDLHDHVESRVELAALDRAVVGAVKLRASGLRFLSNTEPIAGAARRLAESSVGSRLLQAAQRPCNLLLTQVPVISSEELQRHRSPRRLLSAS